VAEPHHLRRAAKCGELGMYDVLITGEYFVTTRKSGFEVRYEAGPNVSSVLSEVELQRKGGGYTYRNQRYDLE
jgi:hypothetical protein